MNTFETHAVVDDRGQIQLTGIPFQSGTRVEVTIVPTRGDESRADASANDRVSRLFAALDKGRNTESIGPLRREEIYDRKVFH
jgi:hypothetical protein